MITEELVNKICTKNNMRKLKISKNPTWITADSIEGIELNSGKVITFTVACGERVYGGAGTVEINRIINDILKGDTIGDLDGNKESTETKDKKDEPEQNKTSIENFEKKEVESQYVSSPAILPDIFTSALLSKWAKMSTVDRMLLYQRTPKDKIKMIAVGKDPKTGVIEYAPYVEGNYMVREANAAFMFDWRFIQQGISIGIDSVCVYGTLEAMVDGRMLSRPAVGYEVTNKKMTPQLAIKSATTDAIKKGLSLFGFNSDVYSGDVQI